MAGCGSNSAADLVSSVAMRRQVAMGAGRRVKKKEGMPQRLDRQKALRRRRKGGREELREEEEEEEQAQMQLRQGQEGEEGEEEGEGEEEEEEADALR
jgi:hypothetical protein